MMKTKLKFFLVFLAVLVGGVNSAWAQSSYEFYDNSGLVNTEEFFHWNGDAYTYDNKQLITQLANGNYLTILKAVQMRDENYISFTTTKAATVYVGVYINANGDKQFKFDDKNVGINVNTSGSYEIIEIESVFPGSHTIKKNNPDVGIYYVRVVEYPNSFNDSYPYIWNFKNWTTTETQLKSNTSYWNDALTYQQSLSTADGVALLYGSSGAELPETKGLKFHSDNKRVSVDPNNCIGIYVSDIIVPNVPKGYNVTIITANTPSANISVSGTALPSTVDVNGNRVYTYNNTSEGNVRLSFAGASNHIMQVYSISVTKGDVPQFELNGNDVVLYDNPVYSSATNKPAVNSLVFEYNASCHYIRFKLNMGPTGESDEDWTSSIAASAFTITNSSNTSVISIDNPAITSGSVSGTKNRVYVYGAKVNGYGTTELTFLFAGNDTYKDKIVKATVTVYDDSHPYIAFSKTTDTYDLVTMNYTEPVLTVLPTSLASSVEYSSDHPTIAIPDNTSNPKGNLMIVNTGVVKITADVTSGGQKYSASYELTIKAEEAVWDIRNGNELYFPTRNTNPDALKNNLYNDNTGKLLVRKVTSIPHMTMEFGDVSNANMAMVAIRNNVRAANMTDQNGWQHAWLNNDNSDWLMKPYQGTFYKFVPSISGNLTIKGVRSHNGSGANIVVLVDKDLVTTGDWDTHVTNGTRTRYSIVTIKDGNTTTVKYYSYPIVKTLNFASDDAYAVTEEPVALTGGHTYYLYAVTPNTDGTRTINKDVNPNTDTSTVGDWQNFYLSGFVFETPDFKFNKKNVVMGTTGVTASGYNRIAQSTEFKQTINDETSTNPNITYSRICKGDINCDIDASTGQLTNILGSGAIVVTATLTETGGATSKTSYVLTVPYTTIGAGGPKSWVFNWDNYNYNDGTPTGDNRMEQVSTLSTNAPASEWTIEYKVRRYASDGTNALNYINVPVLANALEINGDNARYIGTTAGLLFNADASAFGTTTTVKNTEYKTEIVGDGVGRVYQRTGSGDNDFVELTRSDEIDRALTTLLNYNASDAVNPCNYVTMENGTSMTIPNLKAGQHVRIKWSRYSPGQGDRMAVSNLNDLNGNSVSLPITIGAGGNVDRNGGTGYHEFIVAADGDVTFTLNQNGWVNIYKIDVANSFIPTDLKLETGLSLMRKKESGVTFSNIYTTSWSDVLCQSNTNVSYAIKNSPSETRTGSLTSGNCYIDSDNKTLKVSSGGHGRFTLLQNGYVKSADETASYLLDRNETEIKVYEYDYATKSYPWTWNMENMSSTTATALNNDKNLTETEGIHQYKMWRTTNTENNYKLTLEPENVISWSTKSSINGEQAVINELDGLGIRPADITKSNTIILGSANTGIELPSSENEEIITVPSVPNGHTAYIRVKKGGSTASISATYTANTTTAELPLTVVYNDGADDGFAVYKAAGGGNVSDGDAYTIDFYLKNVTVTQVAVSTDTKTITAAGYATEAREYPLDFTLANIFGVNNEVSGADQKAYIVTGVDGENVRLQEVCYLPARAGVMMGSGVISGSTEWPLFTTDVNRTTDVATNAVVRTEDGSGVSYTTIDMSANKLIGVTTAPESRGNVDQTTVVGDNTYYNYMLSAGGYVLKRTNDIWTVDMNDEVNAVGFYLVIKEGTRLSTGGTSPGGKPNKNSAYLQLEEELAVHKEIATPSGARPYFLLDFGDDATGLQQVTTASSKKYGQNDAYYTLQGIRVDKPGKGLYLLNGKKVYVK